MTVTNSLVIKEETKEFNLGRTNLCIKWCTPDENKGYLYPKIDEDGDPVVQSIGSRFISDEYLWYINANVESVGYKFFCFKNNIIWFVELDSWWRQDAPVIVSDTNTSKTVKVTGHLGWVNLNGPIHTTGWILFCNDYGYDITPDHLPTDPLHFSPKNKPNNYYNGKNSLKPITENDHVGYAIMMPYTGVIDKTISLKSLNNLRYGIKPYNAVLTGMQAKPIASKDRKVVLYIGEFKNEENGEPKTQLGASRRVYVEGLGFYFRSDMDVSLKPTDNDYGNYSWVRDNEKPANSEELIVWFIEKYGPESIAYFKKSENNPFYTRPFPSSTTNYGITVVGHIQLIYNGIYEYFFISQDFIDNVTKNDFPITPEKVDAFRQGKYINPNIHFSGSNVNIIPGNIVDVIKKYDLDELKHNLVGPPSDVGTSVDTTLDIQARWPYYLLIKDTLLEYE